MSIRITIVDSTGMARTIEARLNISVMEAAKANGIPEIDSDCGGVCSCASCHVYVDPDWVDRFPPMSKNENVLLSLLNARTPNSRLSCQLRVTEEMDGLIVSTVLPAQAAI